MPKPPWMIEEKVQRLRYVEILEQIFHVKAEVLPGLFLGEPRITLSLKQ